MNMKKITIALALCGSLIAGVAAAGPKWDANGDGSVDTAEKAQRREAMKTKRAEMKAQMLLKYDTNKDGQLDQAEREAKRDAMQTEAFKQLDTDGNGHISYAEFKANKKFFGKHHRAGGRRGMTKVR
jgi:Ca2+-binding EF-hand superfamily protein